MPFTSLRVSASRHALWVAGALLAAGLMLVLGAWIARGSNVLAAGGSTVTVSCADGESSSANGLQWALNQAQSGTPL
ncbi:MAG TPA: hypothetical protein VKU87_05585, partial [Thermomicrobiaceae bacterium]|nr:hypothetical protein [Thermomicrobiaceae bacterium]